MSLAEFFARNVTEVARHLLGAELLVDGVGGLITETEAYHPTEPASHAHRGPTPRNASMFLGPGHVYVYRSYGIHWCLNFVCADGAAILIRALEPRTGIEKMIERRGLTSPRELCSGPGKLAEALAITNAHDGLRLDAPPFTFRQPGTPAPVVTGPRIGITKAADLPWRFGLAGSAYLSKAFRPG
ncbi:DNA-3-methyladenine glycosylase [Devosia sp. CN2-171]|jgi:DNA-3-methyladenine glycosylase|uniref:DNA-3-methyladenine glycosylase n=1 Tax=Devosia sp. CN2-171 TaxID=3400909 RepID=UPI003BF7CB2D